MCVCVPALSRLVARDGLGNLHLASESLTKTSLPTHPMQPARGAKERRERVEFLGETECGVSRSLLLKRGPDAGAGEWSLACDRRDLPTCPALGPLTGFVLSAPFSVGRFEAI